jgi:hypothetical protein
MLLERIRTGEQTLQSIDKNLKDSVSQVLDKLRLIADNKISIDKHQDKSRQTFMK